MINVTKTFLPPFDEYTAELKRAWDNAWITNNGELVVELERKLKEYLGVDNFLFCTNGTVVIQMALKALEITGEVITTPFSYVATTSAIIWENCTPVFVDINESNFCIDATQIESAITEKTQAILATHVYGYACDVDAIDEIAKKYNLKVIYDAAHAFGTTYKGKSIFNYGDVSTCSFHATKLFHTGEGGCLVANDKDLFERLKLYRQFGHVGDDYYSLGINGKNSEFHAAMGLCNLRYIDSILQKRKKQWLYYKTAFQDTEFQSLEMDGEVGYNYAYFPLIFQSEEKLSDTIQLLNSQKIYPRRYFHPALNTLPYVNYQPCPVAEQVSKKIICLPLFDDLTEDEQSIIIQTILHN